MTWLQLAPLSTARQSAAVTVKLTPPLKQDGSQRLVITARQHMIDGLGWWQHGGHVSALLGAGEHDGMLLIRPNGPFRLATLGGQNKERTASLFLPLAHFTTGEKTEGLPAVAKCTDGGLQITLPASLRMLGPALRMLSGPVGTRQAETAPARQADRAESAPAAEPAIAKQPQEPLPKPKVAAESTAPAVPQAAFTATPTPAAGAIAVDPWMVRVRPGLAQPPVPMPWVEVVKLARSEGHDLKRLDDLPRFNKARINRGLPPLAVSK